MEKIKLVEASAEYADQAEQFRREIIGHDPDDGNRFAGCMSLDEVNSAEEWTNMCRLRRSESTCKQGRGGLCPLTIPPGSIIREGLWRIKHLASPKPGVYVPSHTYFAIRKHDNRLVGVIDLRHHMITRL